MTVADFSGAVRAFFGASEIVEAHFGGAKIWQKPAAPGGGLELVGCSSSVSEATGGRLYFDYPAGMLPGDFAVCMLGIRNSHMVLEFDGYSAGPEFPNSSSTRVGSRVFSRVIDGTEGAQGLVVINSTNGYSAVCAVYRGAAGFGADAQVMTPSVVDPTTPGVVAMAGSLILSIWTTSARTITPPGDGLVLGSVSTAQGCIAVEQSGPVAAGATAEHTATLGSSNYNIAATLEILAA
ncbi:hypothetical protein [Phaeovulum sp.]|uniref:hypothetical protein n=1 Tax=Phaeovulum sp. TaxID=2934796 RepID=UPI0039E4B998